MRPLPTPPSPGKPVSATLIRQLIAAISERTVIPGNNVRVKRGPNGTTVNALADASRVPNNVRPWTFTCKEEDGERTGGWNEQIVQIGYEVLRYPGPSDGFKDETNHEDGKYYLKIDLSKTGKSRGEIILQGEDDEPPSSDYPKGVIVVYIGKVGDGKQTEGIYWPPVIYTYQ